jgi:hypothetical protein
VAAVAEQGLHLLGEGGALIGAESDAHDGRLRADWHLC